MKQTNSLTQYMDRAGIRSNRELARLTGIPAKTVDRIVEDPNRARVHQIGAVVKVCGMSWDELGQILRERGSK